MIHGRRVAVAALTRHDQRIGVMPLSYPQRPETN